MQTPPDDEILAVRELSKTYVTFKKDPGLAGSLRALFARKKVPVPAVRSLSFGIRRGEFVGLLGPNGAGKTTTLKMLTGLIAPTGGTARAFDAFDTAKRPPAYLARIGMVMGQRNQLNPDLPAMDSFQLAQAIYGLPEERFAKRLDTCIDLFDLRKLVLTPVRKLSLGERMKMELILAILHEPELLFLDEPTIGLDFNAARQIRGFLREANARLGITVVLTSHYTKDIEELCRRVILINHGTIVYDGALAGMDARVKGQKIVTLVCADAGAEGAVRAAVAAAGHTPEPPVPEAPLRVRFDVPVADAAARLSAVLAQVGGRVADVEVGERALDEIFAEIWRQPKEGGAAP